MDRPNRYEWLSGTGTKYFSDLTYEEWFEVFRTGVKANHLVQWIQPVNKPKQRVTFAENVQSGEKKLSQLD